MAHTGLLLAACLSPLLLEATARACSFPTCGPQLQLPTSPYPFYPGNAVNLSVGRGFDDPSATPPRILDASGTVVPTHTRLVGGTRVFSPDAAALAPGHYSLEYDPRCLPMDGAAPEWPRRDILQFEVGAPQPAPTVAGSLEVIERGTFNEGTFVRVQLVPSPELAGYLSQATFTTTVDGQTFWGAGVRGPLDAMMVTLDCKAGVTTPFQPNTCGARTDIGSGRHHLAMKVDLAGVEADLQAELDVEVACGKPLTTDQTGPVTPSAMSDGGCSIGRNPTPGWPALVGLAALLARLRPRNRRSRRRPSPTH